MLSSEEYRGQDATGLAALVRKGEVSAGELLDVALAEIERLNGLNAVVALNEEAARQVVRALFEHITRGAILDAYAKAYAPPGPLTGALALDYRGPGYLPENRPRP